MSEEKQEDIRGTCWNCSGRLWWQPGWGTMSCIPQSTCPSMVHGVRGQHTHFELNE
jgi:hypothetical protein